MLALGLRQDLVRGDTTVGSNHLEEAASRNRRRAVLEALLGDSRQPGRACVGIAYVGLGIHRLYPAEFGAKRQHPPRQTVPTRSTNRLQARAHPGDVRPVQYQQGRRADGARCGNGRFQSGVEVVGEGRQA